jgi:hypothetical protein
LELSAELPVGIRERSSGVGDILMAAKYSLAGQSGTRPAIAAKAYIKTASGDDQEGFGSGAPDLGFAGVASGVYGRFQLHAVTGIVFTGETRDGDAGSNLQIGLGSQCALDGRWQAAAEITSTAEFGNGDPAVTNTLMGGLIREVSPRLTVDIGYRMDLNGTEPSRSMTFGLSLSQ